MIVAGIGCGKRASAEAVIAAIDAALGEHGLSRDQVTYLATIPAKAREKGVIAAALVLKRALIVADAHELAGLEPRMASVSPASLAATGFASASEAAALAVAGSRARLLGPRLGLGRVTCALAIGEDS